MDEYRNKQEASGGPSEGFGYHAAPTYPVYQAPEKAPKGPGFVGTVFSGLVGLGGGAWHYARKNTQAVKAMTEARINGIVNGFSGNERLLDGLNLRDIFDVARLQQRVKDAKGGLGYMFDATKSADEIANLPDMLNVKSLVGEVDQATITASVNATTTTGWKKLKETVASVDLPFISRQIGKKVAGDEGLTAAVIGAAKNDSLWDQLYDFFNTNETNWPWNSSEPNVLTTRLKAINEDLLPSIQPLAKAATDLPAKLLKKIVGHVGNVQENGQFKVGFVNGFVNVATGLTGGAISFSLKVVEGTVKAVEVVGFDLTQYFNKLSDVTNKTLPETLKSAGDRYVRDIATGIADAQGEITKSNLGDNLLKTHKKEAMIGGAVLMLGTMALITFIRKHDAKKDKMESHQEKLTFERQMTMMYPEAQQALGAY